MKKKEGKIDKRYRDNFAGGANLYLGVRQIKDNESPDMTNCDFYGKGGVGNRQGYSIIGAADATNNDGVVGMSSLHTASIHQMLRFCKNGATDVKMEHSTDGAAWTQVADVFAASLNVDTCQAASKVYRERFRFNARLGRNGLGTHDQRNGGVLSDLLQPKTMGRRRD